MTEFRRPLGVLLLSVLLFGASLVVVLIDANSDTSSGSLIVVSAVLGWLGILGFLGALVVITYRLIRRPRAKV